MSQKIISFKGKPYHIPKDFNYKQFSKEKMEYFIRSDKYMVENHSGVSYDIFNSFFSYLCDQNKLPTVTSSNIFSLRILCEEFGIDFHSIPGLDDENTYKLYCLNNVLSSECSNKSNIERYIAVNLDYFIEKYSKELINVPITSLYNIFYHQERVVDQKKAYQFIIENGNKIDIQFFILLKSIDATKLSSEQIEDCFIHQKDHIDQMPSNLETFSKPFIEKLNSINLIEQAEKKCEILKELVKSNDVTEIELPQYLTRIPNDMFNGCKNIFRVFIPDSVISIGGTAFFECVSLSNITLPNSVKIISDYSFYGCSSILKINIPNSVTIIGDHAFDSCSSLVEISIPDSITIIGESAFTNCSSLKRFEIPSKITLIRNSTFNNCTSLEEIIIHNSVKSIGSSAFRNCSSLKEIDISNISLIESCAFLACSSLEKIEIPYGIDTLKSNTFSYCSKLVSVKLPESVITLETSVFYQCSALESINLSSVKTIKTHVFNGCISLKKIEIENLTTIENYAFNACKSLEQVDIPPSLKQISEGVFNSCENLSTIDITNPDTIFVKYFCWNCPKLTNIIAPSSCVERLIDAGVDKKNIKVK